MNNTYLTQLANALTVNENHAAYEAWENMVEDIMKTAPSGSGFDAGTHLLVNECKPNKLVFHIEYRHMDEHGYYTGWTVHKITITPTFYDGGMDIKVGGRNKNDIKEYIGDVFYSWLNTESELSIMTYLKEVLPK